MAAVAGSTFASRTRIPEKAIDIAPSTAVITGRSPSAPKRELLLWAAGGSLIEAQGSRAASLLASGLPFHRRPTKLAA